MNLLTGILNIESFTIFKLIFYLFEFLYLAFAFVLYKQQMLMAQVMENPQSAILKTIVFIHLLASLILVTFSVLILFI